MPISATTLQGLLVSKLDSLNSDFNKDYSKWSEDPSQGDPPEHPNYISEIAKVITKYLNENVVVDFKFSGMNASESVESNVAGSLGITGVNVVFTKSNTSDPASTRLYLTSQFKLGVGTGCVVPNVEWQLAPVMFSTDQIYINAMSITFGSGSEYKSNMLELAQSVCDSVKTTTSIIVMPGTHSVGGYVGSAIVTEIR